MRGCRHEQLCRHRPQARRAVRPRVFGSWANDREPTATLAGGSGPPRLDHRAVHKDEGISGAKGRQQRPGLDALLKGVTRGEYDLVAAWSVCRLGRSLPDLLGLLGELQARGIDLYLDQQALDTSTPVGRMLFGMLGLFSEFERAMIRDRVLAGLHRARSSGKRLGRPPTTPYQVGRIRAALAEGRGVRETARLLKVSAAKVSEIKRAMAKPDEAVAA